MDDKYFPEDIAKGIIKTDIFMAKLRPDALALFVKQFELREYSISKFGKTLEELNRDEINQIVDYAYNTKWASFMKEFTEFVMDERNKEIYDQEINKQNEEKDK